MTYKRDDPMMMINEKKKKKRRQVSFYLETGLFFSYRSTTTRNILLPFHFKKFIIIYFISHKYYTLKHLTKQGLDTNDKMKIANT